MVSKKNNWYKSKQMDNKKQRFAIKKLSIGVASVLIGWTAFVGTQFANADVQDNVNENDNEKTIEIQDNQLEQDENTATANKIQPIQLSENDLETASVEDNTNTKDNSNTISDESTNVENSLNTENDANVESNETDSVEKNLNVKSNETANLEENSNNDSNNSRAQIKHNFFGEEYVVGPEYNEDYTETSNGVKLDYSLITDEDRKNNPNPEWLANLVLVKMGLSSFPGYNLPGDRNYNNMAIGEDANNYVREFIGIKPVLYVQQEDGSYIKDEEFEKTTESLSYAIETDQSIFKYDNGNFSYTTNDGQFKNIPITNQIYNDLGQIENPVTINYVLDPVTGESKVVYKLNPRLLNSSIKYDNDDNAIEQSYINKYKEQTGLNYQLKTDQATFIQDLSQKFKLLESTNDEFSINTSFLTVDGKQAKVYDSNNELINDYNYSMPKSVELPFYLDIAPEEVTETKTVNRTINYLYEDGSIAKDPVTQSVELTRTGSKNPTTGEVTWDEWSTGNLAEVASPKIKNYKADKDKVNSISVNGDSTDMVENVVYSAETEKVTETKEVKRIVFYVKERYNLTLDQLKELYDDNFANVEINEDYHKLAQPWNVETKEISREGTKNLVTGDIVWGDWSSVTFADKTNPQNLGTRQNGMTDMLTTGSQTVNGDSDDTIYVVVPYYYTGINQFNFLDATDPDGLSDLHDPIIDTGYPSKDETPNMEQIADIIKRLKNKDMNYI